MEPGINPTSQHRAVRRYRARMKREGWVRCEISVRQNDVPLLRTVAAVLSDPARDTMARAVIRESFEMPSSLLLKGLLAAAPLGEMDGEALRAGGRWATR